MTHKIITRKVIYTTAVISLEEAKTLIVEARIIVPGQLDAYEKSPQAGYLSRLFTIPTPAEWRNNKPSEEVILEYARNNIPHDITFGRP